MRTALDLSTPECALRGGFSRTHLGRRACAAAVAAFVALAASAGSARADGPATPTPPDEPLVLPPPGQHPYAQFGVGLAAEVVASPGPICPNVANCILGSGGGLVVRAGWRPVDSLYLGGAYEVSKQDPDQLYRLGILQQIRAEGRRYFPSGREVSAFLLVGVGASGYGNEWAVDTWGGNATFGVGLEDELGSAVVTVSLAYRPMYFQAWGDSSGIPHDAGVAHFFSLEASIESKDRL